MHVSVVVGRRRSPTCARECGCGTSKGGERSAAEEIIVSGASQHDGLVLCIRRLVGCEDAALDVNLVTAW